MYNTNGIGLTLDGTFKEEQIKRIVEKLLLSKSIIAEEIRLE